MASTLDGVSTSSETAQQVVPLRSGPPTRDELLVHYPARFTWSQLKTFVNSGYDITLQWHIMVTETAAQGPGTTEARSQTPGTL